MAFISYVPEESATPQLRECYDECRSSSGQVDNILRIHSHNPRSMRDHNQIYKTLMYGRSPLSRTQREMIAVVVSSINRCFY